MKTLNFYIIFGNYSVMLNTISKWITFSA